MTVQIQGTQIHKKGGGGIGKLLGTLGGAALGVATGGVALAPILAGSSIGGNLGGMAGSGTNPEKVKQLGIPVGGVGPSSSMAPENPSVVDRMNAMFGIGQTVGGAVNSFSGLPNDNAQIPGLNKMSQPNKIDAMNRWMSARNTPNYFLGA